MTFSWTAHRFSGGALALDVANSVVLRAEPERRIDRCDILVRLRCAENQRQARLIARDPDGEARFSSTYKKPDMPQIIADYYFDLPSDQIDFRQGIR